MIEFRIDRRSGVAAYQQLVSQTKHALRLGLLQPGDQLPTVKEVVATTSINPNTVLKAYRELELAGLVEGRRGVGTFVSAALTQPDADQLREELAGWMKRAREDGLDREYVEALVKAQLDLHYEGE
ncbi:GntR family transcriptional regulator [Lentzea sp. NEAU-D13]|uniref:GntR family transcriptional regulator n=1 Tax=Lentzea alba TaxID=2714351 RepID=A0A7C9RS59_9PSEU|nr:GntR family transcriptional regulator [Lentzea alba]NGY61227.1 GntR family transcriptional regulator [Lentzea alba]